MADIRGPGIGDIAALNTAAAELEARLKLLQEAEMGALGTMEEIVVAEDGANSANLKRTSGQVTNTNAALAELAARERIPAAIAAANDQDRIGLELVTQRLAVMREIATISGTVSGRASSVVPVTAAVAATGGTRSAAEQEALFATAAGGAGRGGGQMDIFGGGSGFGGGRYVPPGRAGPPPFDEAGARASLMTQGELSRSYNDTAARLGAFDNVLTQHGYLTSEVIQAAQRGELTYAEWGNQIAGTAAKFGAWTAVSIPIFGAIDAFSKLYQGAVQTSQGIAFVERSIQNLDTGRATQQIQQLSQRFNVPISDAAQAMGIMARQFHNQGQAAQAAQAPLFAEKLGDLDINTAAQRFTGIAKAFKLPASDLVNIYDQVAQAQRRFGVTADQSTTALATAGGVWKTAGGNLSELLALTTALNRVTGGGATGANIATMVSYASSQLTNNTSVQGRAVALGIDPTKGIVSVFDQMMKKAQSDPEDIRAIAGIFGARGSRYLPALLANPEFFKQVQQQTSPQASHGVANYELGKMLAGAEEQIKKIGISLENVGSSLMQSGLLTGVGVLLHGLNGILQAANQLINVFNMIPDPFRSGLATMGELMLLMRAARAMNLGQGLSYVTSGPLSMLPGGVRTRLHDALTQDPAVEASKNLTVTSNALVEANQAEYTRSYAGHQRSLRAAQRGEMQFQSVLADPEATDAEKEAVTKQNQLLQQRVALTADQVAEDRQMLADQIAIDQQLKLIKDDYARLAYANANGIPTLISAPRTGKGIVQDISKGGIGETGNSAMVIDTNLKNIANEPVNTARPGGLGVFPMPGGSGAPTGAGAAGLAAEEGAGLEGAGAASLMSRLGAGGNSLMGGLMTYMMGSLAAQMVGSGVGKVLGDHAGKIASGVGSDAAMGAAAGSFIPLIGTAGGAMIGAGVGIVSDIIGGSVKSQRQQLASLMNTGSARQLQESVAKNGSLAASPFGGSEGDLARNNAGTLESLQKLQLDQAGRNPTKPVSGQDISVLMAAAKTQLADAKTVADKQKVIATFTDAINRSYQMMFDGTKGQEQATAATSQLSAAGNIAGAGVNTADFAKLYTSLSFANQTGYDTYLKDIISEQGLGAASPTGGSAVGQATSISKILESKANDYAKKAAGANNKTTFNQDIGLADKYQKEANDLTENVLNQNSTSLANALNEATDPAGIVAAYAKATTIAQSQMKANPMGAKAELAQNAAAYAAYQQQKITAALGLANAEDPNTVNDAQRTISQNNAIAALMKKAPGEQSQLAAIAAEQNSAAAQSTLLQAQEQQAQNSAQLAQAQAGNNQPLADQAVVSGLQRQIQLLNISHISAAAKAQQLVPLEAQLDAAKLSLFNDTTTWVDNLINASNTLTGDEGNNPLKQAAAKLTAANQVLAHGNFQNATQQKNAQDTQLQARFGVQQAAWNQLLINEQLSHQSISEEIGGQEKFLSKLKGNFSLRQTIEQQILQEEQQASGSYELNVGNVTLPTAYQVRRAEHALRAPHDQQSIVVHAPINVHSNDGHRVAEQIGRHLHTTIRTAVRASGRSRTTQS